MSTPAHGPATGLDLAALDAITDAVESGAGLPEVVRAAARALDASLVLTDRAGAVLAVAARSPADERSHARRRGRGRGDRAARGRRAGRARCACARAGEAGAALVKLVTHADRVRGRAPARARARLRAGAGRLPARPARARRLGPRGHPRPGGRAGHRPGRGREHRRRARPFARADRGRLAPARARRRRSRARAPCSPAPSPCSPSAPTRSGAEVVVLLPGADDATSPRARPTRVLRELQSALPGPHLRARPQPRPRPTRSTCIAPAPRRCWRPTSPRATPTAPCSPSRRRAPTACC